MTSAAKAGRDGDPLDSAFEIQFRGRRVEVAVRAPQDGGDAATVDEVMAALASAPLDTVTKARVEAALASASDVHAAGITVDARRGVVTLTGQVASGTEQQSVGAIVRAIPGVRDVAFSLGIEDPGALP